MSVHHTAIISPETEMDADVSVGPYAVIRGRVKIGAGSKIEAHAIIGNDFGRVILGKGNLISSGAIIGGPPQDLKYNGEPTELVVGDNNVFREFVTVNTGTLGGGGCTVIGDHNLLMAYVHVAHDCVFGSHIVIANTTNFAGHVMVQDWVRIGGVCSFNQFITIGKYSYIAGDSAVNKDVLPFSIAQGKYAVVRATNKIGLDRAGFSKEEIENIHRAIRLLIMGTRTIEESLQEIKEQCSMTQDIEYLTEFVRKSERGIAK